MEPFKPIRFNQPPRSVRLASDPPPARFTEDDMEIARREAYQRGCDDTARLLDQQLMDQRRDIVHLQSETFRNLTEGHQALVEQMRQVLPEFTMEALRLVLAGIEIDRDTVLRLMRDVLAEVPSGVGSIAVRLCARDLELISANIPEFREKYPEIDFRADSELREGDCVVRTRFGAIDGRMSTRLKTVEACLK